MIALEEAAVEKEEIKMAVTETNRMKAKGVE